MTTNASTSRRPTGFERGSLSFRKDCPTHISTRSERPARSPDRGWRQEGRRSRGVVPPQGRRRLAGHPGQAARARSRRRGALPRDERPRGGRPRRARVRASTDGVTVLPHYRSEELPELLAPVTVGALPTYVEGYGLGIVEQLAAGIPSIAYDVPGPRTLLRRRSVDARSTRRHGCVRRTDRRGARCPAPNSTRRWWSSRLRIADRHRLSVLVPRLLAIYQEGLDALSGRKSAVAGASR